MRNDRQGNRLNGASAQAADKFDEALHCFNIYRGDPVTLFEEAIADSPDFAMAHIMKAYLMGVATEPGGIAEAKTALAHLETLTLDERETSHVESLRHLVAGNWTNAALVLDRHNMAYPHDLLGLQCGHLMDFFRANARDMRDRIARTLPKWSKDMPGYSFLLGFYAFGLEEAGDYARAEASGREALALEPLDCWAHHAVAHVMEMQGRAEDGVGWMITREPHWSGDDNFFQVHNWWHKAIYHLDLGQVDQVEAIYDGPIRSTKSEVAVDMVDASALLWRLHLTGREQSGRWQELAKTWDLHADGKLYPFNDWHAAMAYLGAGRDGEVTRLIDTYRANASDDSEVAAWSRDLGLPLIEGFNAFWKGDYETAAAKLHPARFIVNRFGGSHAQRDVIDWTLTEAAIRGGMKDLAEALANERLALKPHSPVNRGFAARAGNAAAAQQQAA